jgi:arylsulfatase A-like enzyme
VVRIALLALLVRWSGELLLLRRLPAELPPANLLHPALMIFLAHVGAGLLLAAIAAGLLPRSLGPRARAGLTAAALLAPTLAVDLGASLFPRPRFRVEHPREADAARPPREARSLLLITIDTLRADHLGAYGAAEQYTPELDRLCRRGGQLAVCLAHVPATTPSHASILTGLEPPDHGSRFNAVPIRAEARTLAEFFRAAGYRTAAFVSAFPLVAEVSGLDRGFEVYDQFLAPDRGSQLLYRTRLARWAYGLGLIRRAERKAWMVVPWVERWLEGLAPGEPFFAWVHFYDPHLPYDPPSPYDALFGDTRAAPAAGRQVARAEEWNRTGERPSPEVVRALLRRYSGEIAMVDRQVGRLLRKLEALGRSAKARVLITADHGESLTEHDYLFAHSRNLHRPDLRVPLLWSALPGSRGSAGSGLGPGPFPSRRIRDLALALAGLTPGDEGNFLVPGADCVYSESAEGVYVAAHRPAAERVRAKRRAVTCWPWRYQVGGGRPPELFNLEEDPAEGRNRADEPEQRARVGALARRLDTLARERMHGEGRSGTMIDEETLETLRALGYVEGAAP